MKNKVVSLEKIEELKFPLVQVYFYGEPVFVKLRQLTQAQIMACGGNDFSLIETLEDKHNNNKKPTIAQIVKYAEMQNMVAKKAMVCPTYEEVFEICAKGTDLKKIKEELNEIEMMIVKLSPCPKRSALEEKYDSAKVWYDLLLPEDFLAMIVSYSLGIDGSDIKEITRQSLLNAAALANRGHDNPSDHCDGRFTEYMKDDINRRAWIVFEEEKKKLKKEK